MAVSRTERGWYSDLCGHFYESEEAALHYDQREQMKRSTPAEMALDAVTTEELKSHINGRLAHDAVRLALEGTVIPVVLITRGIPWYVDSQSNADVLMEELRHRFHERTLTPPLTINDWLSLVLEMRDAGRLEVNDAAIQEAEMARVQEEIAKRKVYSEAELEKMQTWQIERLARGLPLDS